MNDLFIAVDCRGEPTLFRADPDRPDMPEPLLQRCKAPEAWAVLVEGRYPVQEELS